MKSQAKLFFDFELKKLLKQKSTFIVALLYLIFPIIMAIGIASPNANFSVTMGDFGSPSNFSNLILIFFNSLGFGYIVLVMLSTSSLSKEIESKYIYFVLSAVPSLKKLIFYKIICISLIYSCIVLLSSIVSYLAFSILYIGDLSMNISDLGILLWGILINTIVTIIFTLLLSIVNIKTRGNIFVCILLAIGVIMFISIISLVNGIQPYTPSWAINFIADRNNILLLLIYLGILFVMVAITTLYLQKKERRF